MSGHLASIVYSPQPGSYNRYALAEATLLAGHGIDGDRKGGHPNRNLNVMDHVIDRAIMYQRCSANVYQA